MSELNIGHSIIARAVFVGAGACYYRYEKGNVPKIAISIGDINGIGLKLP